MRVIVFMGKELHIAESRTELMDALRKKFGDLALIKEKHHIRGKDGILEMCVENIFLIGPEEHRMQKSLDTEDREVLDLMVRYEIGEKWWGILTNLANQIYIDPTFGTL